MLYCTTKPLYQLENHLKYLRHRTTLSHIEHSRLNTHHSFNTYSQNTSDSFYFKKMRSQSLAYHQHVHEEDRQRENQKLFCRLKEISSRKGSVGKGQDKGSMNRDKGKIRGEEKRMARFNNPTRKERQRVITEGNSQLAVKLITSRSRFDRKTVQRGISEYQKLKTTLANNKKIPNLNRLRTIQVELKLTAPLVQSLPQTVAVPCHKVPLAHPSCQPQPRHNKQIHFSSL